jgi:hypothetical protein
VPLCPLPGAVNVTVTLLIGLLPPSRTVACSGNPKVVPTFVFCPDPPLADMEAGVWTTGTLLSVPEAAFPELV